MKYALQWIAPVLMMSSAWWLAACGGNGTGMTTVGRGSAWTWMSGPNVANQLGSYGTQGSPGSGNAPGGREQAIGWVNSSGTFWLFGGDGYDSIGNDGFLNDLWKYNSGQWTWVSGSNVANQFGSYGMEGVAAPGNSPGGRNSEVRWLDGSGNLWLFGGGGYDSVGTLGPLNDLWKYSNGEWTWVGGSNFASQSGTYGTLGQPAQGNVPGARFHASSWLDANGNFWLFGGNINQLNASGDIYINDLWKYSGGEWAWYGGPTSPKQPGSYGTQGQASAGNIPGARERACAWTDASGNSWLFGGNGYDSNGNEGDLNDLWEYSASSGQWTWVSGSNVINAPATYGTQGTAASGNNPGARSAAFSWTDPSGNFWLFGGHFGNSDAGIDDYFNDVWEYSVSSGQWTWVGGSDMPNQSGTYGTLGTNGSGHAPGGRRYAVGWLDGSGNFWLFSGDGFDSAGTLGYLSDLWKFQP